MPIADDIEKWARMGENVASAEDKAVTHANRLSRNLYCWGRMPIRHEVRSIDCQKSNVASHLAAAGTAALTRGKIRAALRRPLNAATFSI
jgi:hypothetical protein